MTVAIHPPTKSACGTDPILAELVEQFLARLQAGEALDPTGFAAAHGEHAEPLRHLLPALEMMAALSHSALRPGMGVGPVEAIAGPGLGVLGDFHIYYAMQFIDGRTLADVISELRELEGKKLREGDGDRNTAEAGVKFPSPPGGEGARRAGEGAARRPPRSRGSAVPTGVAP